MEAFHLKRLTPVELLSTRKNRKTVTVTQQQQQEHQQQRDWWDCRENRAAFKGCNRNLIHTTAAATTTTTATTTETTTTAIERIKLLQKSTIASAKTSYSSPRASSTIYCSSSTSSSSLATGTKYTQPQLRPLLLAAFSPTPLKLSSLFSTTTSSSSSSNLHIRKNLWSYFYLRHDLTCIMMTMLFVISIVLSGNSALAAQRESFKPKDTSSLSSNNNNNANAIFNEIGGGGGGGAALVGGGSSSLSGGSGNGNAVSHSNANNNISHGSNNIKSSSNNVNTGSSNIQKSTTSLTSTSTSTSTSLSSAGIAGQTVGGSGGYATTISSHTSSSGSSSGGSTSHKSVSSQRNSIDLQENNQNGPYFDKAASKNVTALLGKTAYLNCRVKNLGNKTMLLQVSWVRHRDIHLLTVGRYTYTSDQRFRAIHQPQTEDWILQIKYPQHRDSGIYECQVSTTPHMSHYIHLNVVEPSTEIIGAPDLYIESGSTINLTCVILNSPEPPAYIFWNHNNAIINYDSPRGGVSVVTNKGETTTSFLLIKSARPSDSGHYQCNPSNAKPKSVTVHVLNGEFPAAMQRAALAHHRMSPSHYILVYLSMYLFTLAFARPYIRQPAVVHGQKSAVM